MKPGIVRIIGGEWRGRRLKVLELAHLRPTPDRVRETLFNWLSPYLPGARCLDLFAGTGVLGFEALSRQAAYVEMVDHSPAVIAELRQAQSLLKATAVCITHARIPNELPPCKKAFDIIFIDPPYQDDLLLPCCHYLEMHHFLADSAYIYLEANHAIQDNALPTAWRMIKRQRAGQVFYHLAKRSSHHPAEA